MAELLSGYRLMWMLVVFDLPVSTKVERKSAARFRHFLLDEGFDMAQYSVYLKYCSGRPQIDAFLKRLRAALPEHGKVSVLFFTDKQYEKIVSFQGRRREPNSKNPDQYLLF